MRAVPPGTRLHASDRALPVMLKSSPFRNLMTRIPQDVSTEHASFGMLGVIALLVSVVAISLLEASGHGSRPLRPANLQMLRAYGCEVIGLI